MLILDEILLTHVLEKFGGFKQTEETPNKRYVSQSEMRFGYVILTYGVTFYSMSSSNIGGSVVKPASSLVF